MRYLSILLFILILPAYSAPAPDNLVFSYLDKKDYSGILLEVNEGVISPTYVSPAGASLLEMLITLGAEDEAVELIERYWAILKYTSSHTLKAACLNGRSKVMSVLIEKGALGVDESSEALIKCISYLSAQLDQKASSCTDKIDNGETIIEKK